MESPLNKKIQRSLEREAAKKKKDSNYIPVLTLRQQVLSLVTEANKSAQPERQVTPRAALIVMERALAELTTLDESSREFGVLREVSKFISSSQKTFNANNTMHVDLLPQGNPLSALNASLTPEEYRFKYAQWLAADVEVSSEARALVAAAFSAEPGSLEREHAFMRLNVTNESVPGYFKLDPAPIVAAFSDGNSSAARRARVALQWRDKKGRWVEMGRGADFRFRLPGGGVASASGVYVGIKPQQPGENYTAGLIQVSGDKNLPDGIYAVRPGNVETYSARIPTEALKKAGITPGATPDQSMVGIPSQVDLMSTRRDAPTGWTKQDDNTFTSDDNYTVKVNDGEYTLWRQNEDGSLGTKVGDAANWADINDLANNDQASYDQAKGQADTTDKQVQARIEDRTKQNELFDKLQAIADQGGIDEFGNPLPAGWKAIVRPAPLRQVQERRLGNDIVLNEEGAPSLGYEGPLANQIDEQGNIVRPFMTGGGTWPTEENPKRVVVNGEPYDSWQDFERQIPDIIARMNEEPLRKYGREYKLAPVETNVQTKESTSKYSSDFYDKVKEIALDPSTDQQTKFAAVFDEAQGKNIVDFLENSYGADQLDPSVPKDAEVVSYEADGDVFIVRYPDGTYHNADMGAVEPDTTGNLLPTPVSEYSYEEFQQFWENIFDNPDGPDLVRGEIIDQNLADTLISGWEGESGNGGPDEPPTPPSGPSGGTPPKTPSPSTPMAPDLFNGFDVPNGAFKLNTAEYDVQGRIDEKSTDFTDDPQRLATKFAVEDLISALSDAIIGNSSDASVAEILNANLGDDNQLDAPSEVDVNVDMPQVDLGRPSGAGQLEFNAGAEFVPAESLFNALWHAGVDPNRVLANIYDSVTGDNKNLSKLIEAQGGSTSPEEAQLVDDITAEIRQIKDATPPGESPIANQKDNPSRELKGSLIENIAIDFQNPDYYIPDPSAYIPSQPVPDENGYTDNPMEIGADFEVSDLIMQMLEGITDGSGAALLNFGDITTEVPVEAMRDALQYNGVNTNDILVDLKRESNDMADTTPPAVAEIPAPEVQTPEAPAAEAPAAEVPVDSPENVTPQFVYPGPREAGYTANNTILDSNGVAIGAGSRIQALSDGRVGTIIAVQNIDTKSGRDADYARIRFDDGSTAVRSARQISGLDGKAPVEQTVQGEGPGQLPPARRNPVPQDPSVRFNEPAPTGTPVIAGEGNVPGVSISQTPQDIVEFTNPSAKQSDFALWGLRAPEIARAGRDRATLDNITDLVVKAQEAKVAARNASDNEKEAAIKKEEELRTQLQKLIRDAYGSRKETTFGRNGYTISETPGVSYYFSGSAEDVAQGKGEINISISFGIINKDGKQVGQGSRSLRRKLVEQPDGTNKSEWSVSNNILRIESNQDKKSGFAVAYNRYMEDWYIANGIKQIEVHAAAGGSWQGGFVWALNGFNWDGPNQARRVPAILRSMANSRYATEEEKASIKRMQDRLAAANPDGNYSVDTVPTPLEIALIGWYPDAKNWIGRRQMLQVDWYGVKRLDPSAIEQRQAVNYDQMRNARKRVEGKLNRPGVSREFVLKTNSNEFADANPELAPYIDQIRDVFRSNRSLAVLSPGAKTALNRFTASQLLKGEGRDVSLQDIFKLRVALDAEFKADNPLIGSKDFGVGNQLLDVSMNDIRNNRVPGFTTKELGVYESGVNDTYMVTHNDSGQIFFVKKDSYATQFEISGPGAEVQADAMLRAAGVNAGYETRVSNVDPEMLIMQRAGAGVPLLSEPMTAMNALNKMSINLPDGTTIKVTPQNFMDLLHTPEDAVRVMLTDLIISNMDRHNANLLLAVDGTDTTKIRILPIDHALSVFGPSTEDIRHTVQELFDNGNNNLYGMAMPVLTERLKQDEIVDLFRNEARAMIEGLNNPANLPTGKELDLIIKNFGSLDAYRQKVQERIDALLKPNGEGYNEFIKILNPRYWSRNR